MESILRAPVVRIPRGLVLVVLALLAVVALAAGTVIVGGALLRSSPPSVPPAAFALPPSACPTGTPLRSGDIATIAGTGTTGYTGDRGPATAATFAFGYGGGIAVDPSGTVYVSDTGNHVIRRIGTDGTVTAFAGTGTSGHSGDGGPATIATLNKPGGLVLDAAGDLYVADSGWIRKIDRAGTITTVAGTGTTNPSSGNGGPATAARINAAQLGIGPDGRLYIDDTNNFRTIGPDGTIDAFAGTGASGSSGDGGPALAATFGEVNGTAVDGQGDVFLGDAGGHRIRKVDPRGIITTVAGTGVGGHSGDGGPAVAAQFQYPGSLAIDPTGDLYVSDWEQSVIRRIGTDGVVAPVAGLLASGSSGDCGPATSAALDFPTGIAYRDGAVYFIDALNDRVRMIMP